MWARGRRSLGSWFPEAGGRHSPLRSPPPLRFGTAGSHLHLGGLANSAEPGMSLATQVPRAPVLEVFPHGKQRVCLQSTEQGRIPQALRMAVPSQLQGQGPLGGFLVSPVAVVAPEASLVPSQGSLRLLDRPPPRSRLPLPCLSKLLLVHTFSCCAPDLWTPKAMTLAFLRKGRNGSKL